MKVQKLKKLFDRHKNEKPTFLAYLRKYIIDNVDVFGKLILIGKKRNYTYEWKEWNKTMLRDFN